MVLLAFFASFALDENALVFSQFNQLIVREQNLYVAFENNFQKWTYDEKMK
jgi:hypothetical protein